MIFVLILLAFLPAVRADAAVYYADRTHGSDERTGQSPAEAWQSLARVSKQTIHPGDYVLLKRGEVWREPLVFQGSGTNGLPVTVGSYGDTAAAAPALDGVQMRITDQHDLVIDGLQVRNSGASGVDILRGARVTLRGLTITRSRHFGIRAFNSNAVIIENSEIFENALDETDSFDGIRIDGGPEEFRDFTIRNNSIHHQRGGLGWKSGNGIFLGHTTRGFTTLRNVRITGNDIYANGNPAQNQAGRGVTGTFHGDVTVVGNYIHENASAGLYLGDHGMRLDIILENNTFYNNSLRQFGGFTDLRARATRNTCVVDNPSLTAMGAEIGGEGPWQLTLNTFNYLTSTKDIYRGFIRINDAAQQRVLRSNLNLFYSPDPLLWKLADGRPVTFVEWQAAGFDRGSKNSK